MKTSRGTISFCIIFIYLMFPSSVYAQPDAGTIYREHAVPSPPLKKQVQLPDEKISESRSSGGPSGKTVHIKGFRFAGNENIVSAEELTGLTSGSTNRDLDINDLRKVVSKITAYLQKEKGLFLARAYLPEQDISGGIINIRIISGTIDGNIKVAISEPSRIASSLLSGIAVRAVPEDSTPKMADMERAVLLMNDLPGIEARASVGPGTKTGSSSVIVKVSEGSLLKGAISLDNYGDRYTGKYRLNGRFSLMDPFGLGDMVRIGAREADDLGSWYAGYSVPLGSTGFTFNTWYTYMSYEIGKDLSSLGAEGKASSITADISYPLIRTRKTSIWAGAGFERLSLEDKANGAKTSDRELMTGNVYVSSNFSDSFYGRGITGVSISIARGDTDLSGLFSNEAIDLSGPGTSGGFWKCNYSLVRFQQLKGPFSLYGYFRGQVASGNLDSSQRFILGGPGSVRAYPVGEGSGDEGNLFTIEARISIPVRPSLGMMQLKTFFDAGNIKKHNDPWAGSITSSTGKNRYWLKGAGLGLTLEKNGIYSADICYAREIGSNDGAGINGNDSDNMDKDGRFWFSATIRF